MGHYYDSGNCWVDGSGFCHGCGAQVDEEYDEVFEDSEMNDDGDDDADEEEL